MLGLFAQSVRRPEISCFAQAVLCALDSLFERKFLNIIEFLVSSLGLMQKLERSRIFLITKVIEAIA
jgi:hypothetical protein